MKSICFLLGGFQGNGGIGRVTSIIANRLSLEKGFSISVLSYVCLKDKQFLYENNDSIKRDYLFDNNCSMVKALLCKHVIRKVSEFIKSNNIDILICCGALFFPLGILASKKAKIKCYCWEHTDPTKNHDYKFQMLARKFGIKRCDKLIVLTKEAKTYYEQEYPKYKNKIYQIYNPIDPTVVTHLSYNENSKKIISVGRLTYQKNFESIFSYAGKIFETHSDWQWDIYGEGELRKPLEQLINENGLENFIHLKGQVNNLYNVYNSYSFLVMTSRYEGFPMSLIEGAAQKLPLISYDVKTGPNEIIVSGENGFLVEANDTNEMYKKIIYLIENPATRKFFSDNSFRTANRFELEQIVNLWKQLLVEEK